MDVKLLAIYIYNDPATHHEQWFESDGTVVSVSETGWLKITPAVPKNWDTSITPHIITVECRVDGVFKEYAVAIDDIGIQEDGYQLGTPYIYEPLGWTTSEWTTDTHIIEPQNFPINYFTDSVREVVSFVEEHNGETGELVQTFYPQDYLQSWTIKANSGSAFFGKLNCYNMEIKLIKFDENLVQPKVGNYLKIYVGVKYQNHEYYLPYPKMWIFESREVDGLTYVVQGYDDIALIRWGSKTFKDLPSVSASIGTQLVQILNLYNINVFKRADFETNSQWNSGSDKLNYDPDTPIINLIEDWLEINGCFGYMDYNDRFRICRTCNESSITVPEEIVMSEAIGQLYTLSGVAKVTILGDNVIFGNDTNTVVSLVDNGFVDLHSNSEAIMDFLYNKVKDSSAFYNMDMISRGLIWCEPFQKLLYKGKEFIHSDYTIVYDGGLREELHWEYPEVEKYDFNVPGLDTVLQATTARVDKVNQEIELNVSRVTDLSSQVSNLLVNLDGITSTVSRLDKREVTNQDKTDSEIEELKRQTQMIQTPEQIQLLITEAILNGEVTEVTTTTGFKFNKDGLNITKTGSDLSTIIDNDGMRILKNPDGTMLEANHDGVTATNLTAKNYLQIAHSRFQHYIENGDTHRTGLYYWMGDDT